MSSIPREALKTRASKPGVIVVASSMLSALARAITSCGSEMSAGVLMFITSAAVYPSIRSAPTLKIWITPPASVAMLEKFGLLKIARCSAPVLSRVTASAAREPSGKTQARRIARRRVELVEQRERGDRRGVDFLEVGAVRIARRQIGQ